MTITLFHIDHEARGYSHDLWALASMPVSRRDADDGEGWVAKRDVALMSLFIRGAFKEVATVEGSDLEAAFERTQSNPYQPSWSMMPEAGVTPVAPGYTLHDIPVARVEEQRRQAEAYGHRPTAKEMNLDRMREQISTFTMKDGVRCQRLPFGYKSTSTGDIMRDNETGKVYVVAFIGFDEVAA